MENDSVLRAGLFVLEWMLLIFVGKSLVPFAKKKLSQIGMVAFNYRGDSLPVGMGWVVYAFFLCHGVISILIAYWLGGPLSPFTFHLIWSGGIVLLIGWMDDISGSKQVKGFRGHLVEAFKYGTITTGILKAVGIGAISLIIATLIKDGMWDIFITSAFIALTSNGINLLDLRPGRAWKGVMLLAAIGSLHAGMDMDYSLFVPLAAAAWVLIPDDLKGASMLGDTGANLIGYLVAAGVAAEASPLFLLNGVLLWTGIHWYSERKSISEWIEHNRLMRAVDQWGKKR